jgi:hypothetical protein
LNFSWLLFIGFLTIVKISPLTIDDVRKAVGYGIVMGGNKLFDNSDDKSGE